MPPFRHASVNAISLAYATLDALRHFSCFFFAFAFRFYAISPLMPPIFFAAAFIDSRCRRRLRFFADVR